MSATKLSALATRRHRAQSHRCRRHAPDRRLLCEPLESRLLLSGDSWVLPTGMPSHETNGHREVDMDSAGNVYVAATTDGGTENGSDIFLAKYSPAGQEVWRYHSPVPNWQMCFGAAVAADGFYVTGGFRGTVDFDPSEGEAILSSTEDSVYNGFLAKYSHEGALVWVRHFSEWEMTRQVVVQGDDVYVTGEQTIQLSPTKSQLNAMVAKVTSDNNLLWAENIGQGWAYGLAVYKPAEGLTHVYVAGSGGSKSALPPRFVAGMLESASGSGASVAWVMDPGDDFGALSSRIAVGIDDINGVLEPRVYVPSNSGRLLKLDQGGNVIWSQQVTSEISSFRDVAVYASAVYLVGNFRGSADFDENSADPLVISRGDYDSFLVRYDANDGHLRGVQRMGGSSADYLTGLAVAGGWITAAGYASPPDTDFPASQPGQMSAFVPVVARELYVMRLDAAAPIVHVSETDITVGENTPVTLNAVASAGTIEWYDAGALLGSGPEITVTLAQGTHQISAIATDDAERIGMAGVVVNVVPPTKFYVVDDATPDQTYEYDASGSPVESYALNSGNSAPRGAASTTAGDKLWVVDANRNVYVYNTSGGLLGSWTAGTLNSKSVVEGIAADGTDVWIVDAKTDKVYKYTGAASRTSGTQNAASSFSLNSGNTSPKDIVTDGTYLWVVNDSTTDKVFKYTVNGALVSSWIITTPGATSPTGITIDPSDVSDIWIVDRGTDCVYQYNNAATLPNGSSKAADTYFALAAGNTNPQGIADPPAAGRMLTTEISAVSPAATGSGTDGAPVSLYYVPLTKTSSALRVRDNSLRIDTARLRDARVVDSRVAGGESASLEPTVRLADDSRWARDNHRKTEVDDLFDQWESDPLELLSLPDLGM